jgi:signal peptidase II
LSQQSIPNTPDNTTSNARRRLSWADLAWLLLGTGAILVLDQITKNLVVSHIPYQGFWLPDSIAHLTPWLRIIHWTNSGAAFGIFQNGNLVFLIIGIAAAGFILLMYPAISLGEWPLRLAMILQLAGALGNLIDRIRFGYVIDFISILNLPVFNIADASIALGVGVLLLDVLHAEVQERKSTTLEDGTTQ